LRQIKAPASRRNLPAIDAAATIKAFIPVYPLMLPAAAPRSAVGSRTAFKHPGATYQRPNSPTQARRGELTAGNFTV
jgi:hypothetical protein